MVSAYLALWLVQGGYTQSVLKEKNCLQHSGIMSLSIHQGHFRSDSKLKSFKNDQDYNKVEWV